MIRQSLTLLVCGLGIIAAAAPGREHLDFDQGWRFHLGNAADSTKDLGYGNGAIDKSGAGQGPDRTSYPDAGWRSVDLPHDFVVEQPVEKGDNGYYVGHGSHPSGRNYPAASIGWYRKHFNVPASDEGKRIKLDFDGVFRDCRVWVNGVFVGRHESGYASFTLDVTDALFFGGDNVVTVRADASQYEGWFYEGGGIYRHVWLTKTDPVHAAKDGTYVQPELVGADAGLKLSTEVVNEAAKDAKGEVEWDVLDASGNQVGDPVKASFRVQAGSKTTVEDGSKIAGAHLWSIEDPYLYKLVTRVSVGGEVVDESETPFGVRTIKFDVNKGFFLNGKRVEIKGACNHQDHAGVGAAVPDRLQYYRIAQLKKFGFNAYRSSHNEPTRAVIDACDRLGMLVMDENRSFNTSPEELEDWTAHIKRDRNDPCVIIWSVANEEWATQDDVRGAQIGKSLVDLTHRLDPTRPVSAAGNNGAGYAGLNSVVDIRGMNYLHGWDPDKYHKDHPAQPMYGSEQASTVSTRGEYKNDPVKGYVSAYDTEAPPWADTAEKWWNYFASRPYLAGGFIWTGFDYRGEPTPYGWPCTNSHFGVLDLCGFPKDVAYYYQAVWGEQDSIHLFPHWNWEGQEGKPISVWCFSNLDSVELSLNGKSLGRKKVDGDGHLEWSVPYQPGKLVANGYRGDRLVKSDVVETAGPAAKVVLSPAYSEVRADGEDVAIVNVSVVDSAGRVVPGAMDDVQFDVTGGVIAGVGNGDPSTHEPDVFVSSPLSVDLGGWVMKPASSYDFASIDQGWEQAKPVDISGEGEQIRKENTFAAYRCEFDLTGDQVAQLKEITVGNADDHGRVYINGTKVGDMDVWDRSYSFPVSSLLKSGHNVVTVIVKNDGGAGGLGHGISLRGEAPAPSWHHTVFHGLGQVIVRSDKNAGGLVISAKSGNLESASVTVTKTPAP